MTFGAREGGAFVRSFVQEKTKGVTKPSAQHGVSCSPMHGRGAFLKTRRRNAKGFGRFWVLLGSFMGPAWGIPDASPCTSCRSLPAW